MQPKLFMRLKVKKIAKWIVRSSQYFFISYWDGIVCFELIQAKFW